MPRQLCPDHALLERVTESVTKFSDIGLRKATGSPCEAGLGVDECSGDSIVFVQSCVQETLKSSASFRGENKEQGKNLFHECWNLTITRAIVVFLVGFLEWLS